MAGGHRDGDQLAIPSAALDPGELRAAALDYCRHGWSIVPARVDGKRALVPWRRWQQTPPDAEQIERWWKRWPAANLAVVTGRVSGIVVVDVDVAHGGDRALAELERDHGYLPWLAVAETPSGGWHCYLRHPRFRVASSAGRLGTGIDVRGDGGLALLPPSRRQHAAYRWAVGGPQTVPPMPNAWRRLLRPRPRGAVAATRTAPGAAQPPGGSRERPGWPGSCGRWRAPRRASETRCCIGAVVGLPRCWPLARRRAGPRCWFAPGSPPGWSRTSAARPWRRRWAGPSDERLGS